MRSSVAVGFTLASVVFFALIPAVPATFASGGLGS